MLPKTFKFYNGIEIPTVGLGTYACPPGEVTEAVKDAIDAGYRHIDCAWFYKNEFEVGTGIQAKISDGTIKREEIFITSKLWSNFHEKEQVVPMLKETLKNLKLDYVDLYLIHWPFAFKSDADPWPINDGESAYSDVDFTDTWKGMEEAHKMGLAKSIGISNFNKNQIEILMKSAEIQPVCNQVEVNPNFPNKKLIDFCKSKNIVVSGYCPLGRVGEYGKAGMPKPTILDPKISEIGKKYNKTPAQVILNYLVSTLDIVVLPKSSNKSRIIENFNIFDFKLDKADIEYIDSTNENKRICLLPFLKNHKHYPFNDEF